MRPILTKSILTHCLLLISCFAIAQSNLYVSKQTGQFNVFQGQQGKTTDRYESGNVAINVEGPLKWEVNPNELNIGPNQTKNWTGKVWGDVATAPAPGNSAEAKIKGNYVVNYSRPAGAGGDGAVVGNYQCSGDQNAPCPTHGTAQGQHDLIQKNDVYEVPFRVYSIKAAIIGDPTCVNGNVQLDAEIFPPHGVTTWNTPFGVFQGNNLTQAVPPGFAGGNITVTLSIEGVTYSDTKFMPANTGNLNSFVTTQVCIGAAATAPAVTQVTFAGPGAGGGCPANNLIYAPINIAPSTVTSIVGIPLSVTSGATTLNTSIQAVNKNITTTNSIQIGFSADPIENIINILSGNRCSSGGSLVPNGQFSYTTFNECCITAIKGQQKYEGQMNWSYGKSCRFPFYGIPYVATADFLCGASLNASIAVNGTTQCVGAAQICTDIAANGSLSGGLGVSLAAGFITADLQVVIEGLGFTGSYCFFPPPRAGKIQGTLGKIKVVGSVTGGWGLSTYSVEHVMFEGINTPEFNF